MAGTFEITLVSTASAVIFTASQLVIEDTWFYINGGVMPDPLTLQGIADTLNLDNIGSDFVAYQPLAVFAASLRFNTNGAANISLDGNPPIAIGGLPSGFTPLSAKVVCQCITSIPGWVMFLQQGSGIEDSGTILDGTGLAQTVEFPYDFSFPAPTMLDIINDGCGLRITTPVFDALNIGFLKITGTYEIQSFFQYTMSPVSGTEVDPGETITLTSDPADGSALNFNHVVISMSCGIIVPIVQEDNLFVFTIPLGCDNSGPIDLIATGDGFQFTGPVTLGTLTILLADASGIYRLVKDKTTDTLYSGARDGTTFDVKIPNPRFKTGYIDG